MTSRSYGQFCGLARAADVIGQRWALLIVRDLLLAPKRFTELRAGLPGIPTNVLTTRLKELEASGVIERVVAPAGARGLRYQLTPRGRALEPALTSLSLWGAATMDAPREGEVVTPDSVAVALRTAYIGRRRPGPARTFEVRVGPVTAHAVVHQGALGTVGGPAEHPDLVIDGRFALRHLLAGLLDPAEAVRSGAIAITGDPALLVEFVTDFHVPLEAP